MKWWFWLIFCSFFFAVPILRSINRELPAPLPVLYTLPEFELMDENSKVFGSKDLKGKPYLVNFHFTSCPTICKDIMRKTQRIQKRIRGLGQKVQIISITVDPDRDTPQKLFEHARSLRANPFVWKFLTGSKEKIKSLVVDGFKSAMGDKELGENLYDITHSSKVFLVDAEGEIRSIYSMDKKDINRMMIDLGLIVNRMIHIEKGA